VLCAPFTALPRPTATASFTAHNNRQENRPPPPMKSRLLSTLAIWFAVGAALYYGQIWGGLALLLLVSGAAHWEFCRLLERCGGKPNAPLSVAMGLVILVVVSREVLLANPTVLAPGTLDLRYPLPGLLIGLVSLTLLLLAPAKLTTLFTKAPTAFSWLYIPCSVLPAAVLAAEYWANGKSTAGLLLVLWTVAVVKFADCGALITGLSFGEKRHRMAPAISPGKSWEGCAGGIVFSAATGAGIAWLYAHFSTALNWPFAAAFTPAKAALIALPLAALSIPSDLIESAFKRKADVKDSGRTIPGIGGAFDLLDSLILTIPAAYVLLKLFL
jgi:phosphatidate cytidylyltransferase